MSFRDLLWMSWLNLRRRKLRTFLTVLGVIIGTASIVVMISLGIGMQRSMYAEMEEYGGATLITVSASDSEMDMDYDYESDSDIDTGQIVYVDDNAIEEIRQMDHVSSVEPVYSLDTVMIKGKYEASYTTLTGMTPSGLATKNITLSEGTLPEEDSSELQLVFGNQIIMNFMADGEASYWDTGELPDIDLMKDTIFVVLDADSYYESQFSEDSGLYDEDSDGTSGDTTGTTKRQPKKYVAKGCGLVEGQPEDYNANSYYVYCDLDTLIKLVKREYRGSTAPGQLDSKKYKNATFHYTDAEVRVDNTKNVSDVAAALKKAGYNVETNAEELESVDHQMAIIEAVLGGIGAISLLVAAIGIANTMMMSIYERTKEIGVMKVLGCSLANIQQMFLLEAGFIGFIGGVVGNLLSIILSVIINKVVGYLGIMSAEYSVSHIPIWLVFAATAFAIVVGVLAGYFPSKRAMQLSPLAAIRNE